MYFNAQTSELMYESIPAVTIPPPQEYPRTLSIFLEDRTNAPPWDTVSSANAPPPGNHDVENVKPQGIYSLSFLHKIGKFLLSKPRIRPLTRKIVPYFCVETFRNAIAFLDALKLMCLYNINI